MSSISADKVGLKKIKLGTAKHLPLDELDLGDLTFGLPAGPQVQLAELAAAELLVRP